jgi:hypothetical protein
MDNLRYHQQSQRILHIELGLILPSFPIFLGVASYFMSAFPVLGVILWVGLVYYWGHHKQRKLDSLAEPRHTDEQMRALGYLPPDTVVQYTDGRVIWESPVQYAKQTQRWWRVKPQEDPENVA